MNLGAGSNTTKNWINIDASPNAFFSTFPKGVLSILYHFSSSKVFKSKKEYISSIKDNNLIHFDLEKGIPIKSNSVIEIYSHDFIEHLFRKDGERILQECFRILQSGGKLRIYTQDLNKLIKEYEKGKKEDFYSIVFNRKEQQYFSMHKFIYSFEEIKKVLLKIGFKGIHYVEPENKNRRLDMIIECKK